MDDTNTGVYNIGRLTHRQVERHVLERPAVIVPLGGCEPFGAAGALGVESVCTAGVAGELSERCRVLAAPLIPFGCSTPFMSFAGAAGVKPRTFVNMLCEILHGYVFQGVRRIFLVSAAPFNREPGGEVVRRLSEKYPEVAVMFFDINSIGINDNIADRDDALLLSVFLYLGGAVSADDVIETKSAGADKYRTWKKRGRDPQKLRALFPDGLMVSAGADVNIVKGEGYFNLIVETLEGEINSRL
ncbi:MAG: creatininase family protein [Chitinispirillales bacterium]|jgi:creatinine amidohydrolase/Fe(II)-dependent formamide hydrolase-like protein|nr:creatininase family protein [Chitinispirillales bacterium]